MLCQPQGAPLLWPTSLNPASPPARLSSSPRISQYEGDRNAFDLRKPPAARKKPREAEQDEEALRLSVLLLDIHKAMSLACLYMCIGVDKAQALPGKARGVEGGKLKETACPIWCLSHLLALSLFSAPLLCCAAVGAVQQPRAEILAAIQVRQKGLQSRSRHTPSRIASDPALGDRHTGGFSLTQLPDVCSPSPPPRSLFYDLCWPSPQYFPHYSAVADTPLAPLQVLEAARESFQDAISVAAGLLRMPADRMPPPVRATLQGWQKVAMTNIVAMGLMVKARCCGPTNTHSVGPAVAATPPVASQFRHNRAHFSACPLVVTPRMRCAGLKSVSALFFFVCSAAARPGEREHVLRFLDGRGVPNSCGSHWSCSIELWGVTSGLKLWSGGCPAPASFATPRRSQGRSRLGRRWEKRGQHRGRERLRQRGRRQREVLMCGRCRRRHDGRWRSRGTTTLLPRTHLSSSRSPAQLSFIEITEPNRTKRPV